MHRIVFVIYVALCYGQNDKLSVQEPIKDAKELHNNLSEKIGNFSIEVLFHTAKTLQDGENFIMSPITVWSVLAVMAEGAAGETRNQLNNLLRIKVHNRDATRSGFTNITNWLQVNTNTAELEKVNAILVDKDRLPLQDIKEISKDYYQTEIIFLDFKDTVNSANFINTRVSNLTHGKIPSLVDSSYFQGTQMVLTSALYFKGQWSVPFIASLTVKAPFYDTNEQKIGDVNMMYNRFTLYANIRKLQARVIELSYGNENRLSMLIMLPYPGVSPEDMFVNFLKVNLDTLFEELRVFQEEYSDVEVDCFIPRFKIQSDIDLTNVLKGRMGIKNLFDQSKAQLPFMSRTPIYVSKVIHKAKIEVTEDGRRQTADAHDAEFSNRKGIDPFRANRPFAYVIIEKVTNSIVFGGFYKTPSLY